MTTSINTYSRGFVQIGSAAENAGNYESSCAASVTKFFLALTVVGYCVWQVLEKYLNVKPKVKEFTKDCKLIYSSLASRHRQDNVSIALSSGRIMRLTEHHPEDVDGIPNGIVTMQISNADGSDSAVVELFNMDLDRIQEKLREDMVSNRALYHLDEAEDDSLFSCATYDLMRTVKVTTESGLALPRWWDMRRNLLGTPLPTTAMDLRLLLHRTLARLADPQVFGKMNDNQLNSALANEECAYFKSADYRAVAPLIQQVVANSTLVD